MTLCFYKHALSEWGIGNEPLKNIAKMGPNDNNKYLADLKNASTRAVELGLGERAVDKIYFDDDFKRIELYLIDGDKTLRFSYPLNGTSRRM